MKEFLKFISIWQIYRQLEYSGSVFGLAVYIHTDPVEYRFR